MSEKKFVDGLIVKRNERAPEYVICSLAFKTDEFTDYINKNQVNGWLNVDVKLSQNKKYYAQLNTYVKGQQKPKVEDTSAQTDEKEAMGQDKPINGGVDTIEYPTESIDPADIPF